MNQPTREEFEHLEEEQRQLKEEVRKLKEQITEPIKITRLEIDSGSMHKRLDSVQEDTNILKIQMEGVRADIRVVKANQSDLRGYLDEQFKSVEERQSAHSEILGQLVNFAESHEKNMATKDDVASIKGDIRRLEIAQTEQGDLLKLILAELRKSRGE